jgi:hypothetical protein
VSDEQTAYHRAGAGFWVCAAVGWALIGVGVRGIFTHRLDTRPANLARFVVGGALLHDLVVAPLVIIVGVLLARVFRGRGRAGVQAVAFSTVIIALFAYPLVRSYGRAAHNPSSLPHNYAVNLLVVLGIVWVIMSVVGIVRWRRASRASS